MSQIISVIGTLCRDPKEFANASGRNVAKFDIAAFDGWNECARISYFRVSAWLSLADKVMKRLHKGSLVCVRGETDPFVYTTRTGEVKAGIKINARSVEFLYPQKETLNYSIDKEPMVWQKFRTQDPFEDYDRDYEDISALDKPGLFPF